MKFYICPMPEELADAYDGEDVFTDTKGVRYNYSVEFYPDDNDITITDNLDRFIPVPMGDVPGLIRMLERIYSYSMAKEESDSMLLQQLVKGALV